MCVCVYLEILSNFNLIIAFSMCFAQAYSVDITKTSEFSSTAGFTNISSAPVTIYNKVCRDIIHVLGISCPGVLRQKYSAH